MLSRARIWKKPALMTLTPDRHGTTTGKGFQSPRQAFETVTRGKFIPRLMRALGVKLWAWALEFQQATGDGWPHWHLLIDLADLPRGRLDLKKAWSLWRDAWGIGGVDLQVKEVNVQSPEHAINYLTKYLTKMPEGGFPPWVLESHGVRFVQGCRRLGCLVAKPIPPRPPKPDPDPDEKPKPAPPRRSHLARLARCKLSTNLLETITDHTTGELRRAWRGRLPGSPLLLAELAARGLIAADVRQEHTPHGRPCFVMYGGEVEMIREQLQDLGVIEWTETEATDAAEILMMANLYAARDAQGCPT